MLAYLGIALALEVPIPDGRAHGVHALTVERGELSWTFDLRDQVHAPLPRPVDLDVRLVDVASDATGDRLATLWSVLATGASGQIERGSWIGILEPSRARLAGFPLASRPGSLSLSGDGETLVYADDTGLNVVAITPPPRPAPVEEPDSDPPLVELEPLLFLGDLEMLDFDGFVNPFIALELQELDTLDLSVDDPGGEPHLTRPVARGPGAQRLEVRPVSLQPALPAAPDHVALSFRGHRVAASAGRHVALWESHRPEPTWRAKLGKPVVAIRAQVDGFYAELEGGDVVFLGRDTMAVR